MEKKNVDLVLLLGGGRITIFRYSSARWAPPQPPEPSVSPVPDVRDVTFRPKFHGRRCRVSSVFFLSCSFVHRLCPDRFAQIVANDRGRRVTSFFCFQNKCSFPVFFRWSSFFFTLIPEFPRWTISNPACVCVCVCVCSDVSMNGEVGWKFVGTFY